MISKKPDMSKLKKVYDSEGFILLKNFLDKKQCSTALKWLNRKNKKKLVKSWTEQEPGVDAAIYFVVHNKKNPISDVINNKKIMKFAKY